MIFPLQDVLGYDSSARMNTPGTASGNWSWRFTEGALRDELAFALREDTILYGRYHMPAQQTDNEPDTNDELLKEHEAEADAENQLADLEADIENTLTDLETVAEDQLTDLETVAENPLAAKNHVQTGGPNR